jgi:glycerol-3-phosphate dehydrogenase
MHEFSYRTRKIQLGEIAGKRARVLIVGGGIVGAGVANILAQNGLQPVLVERCDFASGTSSGSSKLIHGGLRYISQGRFLLVRDLLRERNYLLDKTDIVKKLNFDIVVDDYSWGSASIRAGLFLYGILGNGFSIPRRRRNTGKYPAGVRGYFSYWDGVTDDASLVIYNIVSAQRNGARCLNYTELKSISWTGGWFDVRLSDRFTGEERAMEADAVVNCAGPWAMKVAEMCGIVERGEFRLSKGVHIIVDRKIVPVSDAVVFRSHLDGRQMFVIPREKVVIIGTTDEFVDDPDDFSIPEEHTDYIVRSAARLFPSVTRESILTSYAGIRPLFGRGSSAGSVSREFSVSVHGRFISVFGGKLTDYRSASRRVASVLARVSGLKIRTKGMPVVDYARESMDGNPYEYAIMHECAMTFEDIARRRFGLSIYSGDLGASERDRIYAALEKHFGSVPK